MTRIYDLPSIPDTNNVPPNMVIPISNGVLTSKITLDRIKSELVKPASSTSPGFVKIGKGLSIDPDGFLSVLDFSNYNLPIASETQLGGVKIGSGLSINNNGVLTTSYPLQIADNTTFGLVKIGNGITVTAGVISIDTTDFSQFKDSGYKVGTNDTLQVSIVDDIPVIKSNSSLMFTVLDSDASDGRIDIKLLNKSSSAGYGNTTASIIPDSDGVSLGSPSVKWKEIHAEKLFGDISGTSNNANELLVLDDNIYRQARASIGQLSNTIAARDSLGNLTASKFVGDLIGIADKAISANSLLFNNTVYTSTIDIPDNGTPNTVPLRDSNGNINAKRFNGITSKSDMLKLGLSYVSTSTVSVPNTIVGRDTNSNIAANRFIGVAMNATYADLAEKYVSDNNYEEGTVVIFGGEKEITVTTFKGDYSVAGVISKNPAYLMNADSSGTPVALRGKVPVKVIGPVSKGDLLITSSIAGYAMAVQDRSLYGSAVFAKSIENKTNHDRGLIMAVII